MCRVVSDQREQSCIVPQGERVVSSLQSAGQLHSKELSLLHIPRYKRSCAV